VLIIRGGLDGSGTEALYQAPTSSASARRSMAPDMLRSSAAATICPLPTVRSTACGFDAVYFVGRHAEKPLAAHEMIAYYPGPR
jgi:hypothetical protein